MTSTPGDEPRGVDSDTAYGRPVGVEGGFSPRPAQPEAHRPTPADVDPRDAVAYGRPQSDASFDPAAGDRLNPRRAAVPSVPNVLARTFGAPDQARNGFAPDSGTRLYPTGPVPESPWWHAGAEHDPWRDPTSPFWLGRGAVFTGGRPEQLAPSDDTARDPDDPAPPSDAPRAPDTDEQPPGRTRRSTLFLCLVVALVAGLVGGAAGWWLTRTAVEGLHRPDASIAQVHTPKIERPPSSVAGIASRVGPAVVSIAVRTPSQYAIGSGVVVDKDGDVLTNNHVVAAAIATRHSSIVVTFSDHDTATAQVVGADPISDLAVIKVPNQHLTVAQLGRSSQLAVGDPVVAIGSPLGLQGTVTSGIVSALDRPVHVFADNGSSDAYLNAIQTDAPINPGNSGGALVDLSGAVIGINSAAATSASGSGAAAGIGYAIPIDYARTIALELIRTGKAVHGSLGAQGRTVQSGLAVGAYLVQISPGGPAAKAGLRAGDVIVAAGGTVVGSYDQLVVIVQQRRPGDRLPVTYYPVGGSQQKTTTVVLG